MNDKYFADKIIELSNKELEINEYRSRVIAIIGEIRAEERTKHTNEGTKQYKRIDEQNPIRTMPKRDVENEGYKPTLADFTNEARFTPEERIGED